MRRILTFAFVMALAIDSSTRASAQERQASPASVTRATDKPGEKSLEPFQNGIEFVPKGPNEKVAFSLEDADLSELLRVIGQITGRRFVIASNNVKSFKATVYSPQKITVAEAYQAFLSILAANRLTVIPAGGFWKVVDTQDIAKQPTPIARRGDATTGEERYITQIRRLEHVSADDVAQSVLAKFQTKDGTVVTYPPGNLLIITDTGENIRRMGKILEEIDVGSATDKVWLEPLYYVSSSDVEKKLGDILDLKKDDKGKPPEKGGTEYRITKLVALERPNALVIVGSEASYKRALEIIKRIDVQVSSEGDIHVVPLQYADAKKIVPALNEAVQGAGGAAAGGAQRPGAGPLAILEAPVKISAEETTNSILVTSSDRDFAAVRDVIQKLDKPRRQVYIEAVVMDVSLQKTSGLGVKYHMADSAGGGSFAYGGLNPLQSANAPMGENTTDVSALALGIVGPSVTAFGATLPAFGAIIEAHTQSKDYDILQTPHILATDNTPAEIHSQLNTSLQRNAASLGAGAQGAAAAALSPYALGTAPASANYGKIGPKLQITPHLNESDEVRLDLVETISDIVDDPSLTGSLGTISYLERSATTTLTVRDQQTVVIGGLVRDKVTHAVTKIPFLGDIPILGALFRSSGDSVEKSNLVLVLTPYIIREQDDLRRIYERKMEERQDFIDHTQLFSEHHYEPPKDYSRTKGILEDIRQRMRKSAEDRKNQDAARPTPAKVHEPSEPLELPASPRTNASGDASAPKAATANAPAAMSAPRIVERVER